MQHRVTRVSASGTWFQRGQPAKDQAGDRANAAVKASKAAEAKLAALDGAHTDLKRKWDDLEQSDAKTLANQNAQLRGLYSEMRDRLEEYGLLTGAGDASKFRKLK